MTSRPPPGSMVYWRFKRSEPSSWTFGYVTYVASYNMIRMGRYNGDSMNGTIVDVDEIEWREYRS